MEEEPLPNVDLPSVLEDIYMPSVLDGGVSPAVDEDELLVQMETRVRQIVESSDLQSMTKKTVLAKLKAEFGEEACERHRKRLGDCVTHVAEQMQQRGEKEGEDDDAPLDLGGEKEDEGEEKKKKSSKAGGKKRERGNKKKLTKRSSSSAAAGAGAAQMEDVELEDVVGDKGGEGEDLFAGLEQEGGNDGEQEEVEERDEEDEDEGDEDGGRGGGGGGKKKKKKQQPTKKRKKKEKLPEDADVLEEKKEKPMTSVMKVFKEASDATRARTRVGAGEPKHDDMMLEVQDLLQKMQSAVDQDRDANEQEQPAVCRAKESHEVERILGKAYLGEPLVEQGVLGLMAEWLKPLPKDGSAAPISVRQMLLRALLNLKVDWADGMVLNQLKKAQLGKHIMHMYRTETVPENRLMAEKLIEMWSRPVFTINDDWTTLAREEQKRAISRAQSSDASKSLLAARRQAEIQQKVDSNRKRPSTRAKLPYAGESLTNFVHRPAQRRLTDEGQLQRVAETSQQVIAAIHMEDEIAKQVVMRSAKK